MGASLPATQLLTESMLAYDKPVGFEFGLEGAYFFSKRWGIGGDVGFISFPIEPLKRVMLNKDQYKIFSVSPESLGSLHFDIGPYFSYDLTENWQFSLKGTAGYAMFSNGKIFIREECEMCSDKLGIIIYKPVNTFQWNFGSSLTYKLNPDLGITGYIDYNQLKTTSLMYGFDGIENEKEEIMKALNILHTQERIKYFTIGLRLTAYF